MSWLTQWTVDMPGFSAVTVFADTAASACCEAADMFHLPDVPNNTTARDERGQEFVCSSAP